MKNAEIRLQKVLADAGITSRRKAEQLILAGRVTVNGEVTTEMGTKVNPHVDVLTVDGNPVDTLSVDHVYILLNKPRCVVTTVSDPEGRPTVIEYLRNIPVRVYPVGRLDYLSEGLLLLTNDGELANEIMHPRYEVTKVYEVKVFGKVNEALVQKLKAGVYDHDGLLKPKSVRVIEELNNKTWIEFRMQEGKNREIRRLCEAVGLTIDKLRRVAIEGLSIQGIQPGEWKFITKKDLLDSLGMNKDGSRRHTGRAFLSHKKTIDMRTRKVRPMGKVKMADDSEFHKFRKETYFETIQQMKEMQEEYLAKTEAEKFTTTPTKFSRKK